jgi:hypothetical protein
MKLKLNLSAIYLSISLIALFFEPSSNNVSLKYYFGYYIIVLVNLAISVHITNKLLRNHDTAKNRN